MWQASIYMGKLFKFNHSFALKSMWEVVFELCSSEIKITEWILAFIEKRLEEKHQTSYYKQEQVIWNLNRRCKVCTVNILKYSGKHTFVGNKLLLCFFRCIWRDLLQWMSHELWLCICPVDLWNFIYCHQCCKNDLPVTKTLNKANWLW